MQNSQASGGRKDVPQDIPERRNDVELALHQVKFFGAHAPESGVRALHRHTGLHQNEFRNVSGLCDPAGPRAVARSNIKQGAASRRYPGDHQLIDAVQIRSALFGDAREHRPELIVCSNWV